MRLWNRKWKSQTECVALMLNRSFTRTATRRIIESLSWTFSSLSRYSESIKSNFIFQLIGASRRSVMWARRVVVSFSSRSNVNCFQCRANVKIYREKRRKLISIYSFSDANFENWILINQNSPTFGTLSGKGVTDTQDTKYQEENIDDDDSLK